MKAVEVVVTCLSYTHFGVAVKPVYHGRMKKFVSLSGALLVTGLLIAGCSPTAPSGAEASPSQTAGIASGEPNPGASAEAVTSALPADIPFPSSIVIPDSVTAGDRTWSAAFMGIPSDVETVLFPNLEGSGFAVRTEDGVYIAENDKYVIRFGEPDTTTYPEAGYTANIVEK